MAGRARKRRLKLLSFETKSESVLPRPQFARRLALAFLIWCALAVGGLAIGMTGYMATEGMGTLDAFLNAAMILSGMGPVSELHSAGGKAFAGFYALFSGLFIVVASGFVLAPLLHRVMHAIHADDDKEDADD